MSKLFDSQNLQVALVSIKSQRLRTILTVSIIAIGIMALVGILTAIDALKLSINQQFSSMGANSFSIRSRRDVNVTKEGKKLRVKPYISYREAQRFVELYQSHGTPSLSVTADFNSIAKFDGKESNPNVRIIGSDHNYLLTQGYNLSRGRNFSMSEARSSIPVCLIGTDIKNSLFENRDAVDEVIQVGNRKYRVIGVMEEKGNAEGFGGDRVVIIPVELARQNYGSPEMNFVITIATNNPTELETAVNEAIGSMRVVRKDLLGQEDSFSIYRSDSLSNSLIENLSMVSIVSTVIAFITLLGAAIGLMNIMLVSVTERTREIGTRKAVGAKPSIIRNQFLTEAIVITQSGGLVGVILGIIIGLAVAQAVGSPFFVPWAWIILALILCFITGISAGYYPAVKAAQLDPVEALRHE